MTWISNAIAIAWTLICVMLSGLGIAHFVLWKYIDKKYDVLLVKKEKDDGKA